MRSIHRLRTLQDIVDRALDMPERIDGGNREAASIENGDGSVAQSVQASDLTVEIVEDSRRPKSQPIHLRDPIAAAIANCGRLHIEID